MLEWWLVAAAIGSLTGVQANQGQDKPVPIPTVTVPPPAMRPAPPAPPAPRPIPIPAEAKNEFTRCDGSLPPSATSPNMQRYVDLGYREPRRGGLTGLLAGKGGVERAATGEYVIAWGKEGAAACARALSDSRLANWPFRRDQLRRAEVIHLLASDDRASAASKLDLLAQSPSMRTNRLYGASLSVSIQLIRSWLARTGDQGGQAKALADRIALDRHYSPTIRRATLPLQFSGSTADWPALDRYYRDLESIDPAQNFIRFGLAARDSDFQDVIVIDRSAYRFLPSQRKGWTFDRGAIQEGLQIASYGGHTAYAFAALGRDNEATARLALARVQLERFLSAEFKALINKSPARLLREQVSTMGLSELARWEATIAARRQMIAKPGDPANAHLVRGKLPGNFMYMQDLLPLIRSEGLSSAMVSSTGTAREIVVKALSEQNAAALGNALPDLDYLDGQLTTKKAENWLTTSDTGISFDNEKDGTMTIRYGAGGVSEAVAEELVTLAAARKALALGKTHFIILSRQTLPRVRENCTVYPACLNTEVGNEAQLRFIAFNPGAVPTEFQPMAGRAIDAAAAQRQIEGQYGGLIAAAAG